jgi:predicted ATPase
VSVFKPWPIEQFRRKPWSDALDTSVQLAPDASNVAAVLRQWEQREHREKLSWVQSTLSRIYPTVVSVVDAVQEGPIKFGRCLAPGDDATPLSLHAMSSGVLSALFTLVAVAGARRGATLLFDEADNSLHPSAIRRLIEAVRARANETGITVVFATHSPVVLDAFNDDPESVWVMRGGDTPRRLTEECDAEWLASFRLGNIYGSAFGAQEPADDRDPLSGE